MLPFSSPPRVRSCIPCALFVYPAACALRFFSIVYLVGGQQFTLNEVTDSPEVPRNVVAFINAWRAKKDVWHSPNNDVHFGVRVKDVSMYEYRVGQPAAPKAEEEKVEAEVAAEAQAKAEA